MIQWGAYICNTDSPNLSVHTSINESFEFLMASNSEPIERQWPERKSKPIKIISSG
jgi:hypothetical protein